MLKGSQGSEDITAVMLGLDFQEDLRDVAVRIDD